MIKLNNLAGTIMLEEQPLLKFKFEKDRLVSYELYCRDYKILPFEFKDFKVTDWTVRCFFEHRIVPETRIGLQKTLEEHGMKYYDPETIIRYQSGRCFDDPYWVKCE